MDFLENTKSAMDLRFVKLIEVPEGMKVYADGNSSRAVLVFNGGNETEEQDLEDPEAC